MSLVRGGGLFALLTLASCATHPNAPASPSPQDDAHGRHGVHGMIVVGAAPNEGVFFSHIPTTHRPHDFQLVFEGAFAPRDGMPARFDDALFTFEPAPFSLDELRTGALPTFRGDLYRGNFEDGGVVVAKGVTVDVGRILYVHPLAALPATRGTSPAAAPDYFRFSAPDADYRLRILVAGDDVDELFAKRHDGQERRLSCLVGPEFATPCPAR